MDDRTFLAERFEAERPHLRAVAYRMLGSLSEAEDAVQEAWLRLARSDAAAVENLAGWLTTVVARLCLDMLRSRNTRREEQLESRAVARDDSIEQETVLADSVGLALLVVLETLAPAERVAFVLHDLFGVPFEEIAPIVDRTPTAARQLASRARRRVQGSSAPRAPDRDRQREIVDAFLAAARGGDMAGLLAVLDPEVVMRTDAAAVFGGIALDVRGAQEVAGRAVRGGARAARPALVDGAVGIVVAPRGQLLLVLRFTIENDRIVAMEGIGEPDRLRALELSVLPE
jgi:RNA polymerase sigma-70 factor (ECF subfamily)